MKRHIIICSVLAMSCSKSSEDEGSAEGSEEVGSSGNSAEGNMTADETMGSAESTTGGVGSCGEPGAAEPIYPPPGECYNNQGCGTCNCLTFRDNPPDAMATCAAPGAAGSMRVTATLFEFPSTTPIANQAVTIHNAFQVGTLGIMGAPVVAMATSDAMGRFDTTIMPDDMIGMVAIVQADGFRATATGLAKPGPGGDYEPSNAIHDIFVVRESDLVAWSDALAGDAAVADHLPLGEAGGVVGVARNRYTGEPVAGLEIVSKTNGDATMAVIRYLQDDGTFTSDVTGAPGVYVLVNPALAEEFEAEQGGTIVSTRANKAGSGPPGVFTMNLTIDTDPGDNPFD
ncbi:MAG TPA: hypothetical protein VG755_14955 [Nannocystaceae bacterium]|nr:hypothetical protein [Nannocystaceae bacterium]